MIPSAFDYVRPADLGEALRILKEHEGEAKVLSGGFSLLPLIKLRLAQPGLLVDLRDVGGLDGIARSGDEFRIGARATHRRILEDPALAAALPIMRDAAAGIGDPQIRNWGTIGGSVRPRGPGRGLAGGPPGPPRRDRPPQRGRRAGGPGARASSSTRS